MIKITERKIKRLKKSMQEIDPIRYQNDFGNKTAPLNQKISFVNYDYMDGHKFEYFCAYILRKNGFDNVEVTQGSNDHGIDILAEKDSITYAIQCKCYSSNIGNAAIQQAHTGKSLYHKDIAVVLTNQYFTPQAKEEAYALGVKLWDRDKLNEFIREKSDIEFVPNKSNVEDDIIKNDTMNVNIENKKYTPSRKTQKFDLDAFAVQCNAYLEHEDEMEQYK